MLTPEDLDRLDELRFRAERGPYEYQYVEQALNPHTIMGAVEDGSCTSIAHTPWTHPKVRPTFEFITAACNANEALVAGYREMEAEVRRLRARAEELLPFAANVARMFCVTNQNEYDCGLCYTCDARKLTRTPK